MVTGSGIKPLPSRVEDLQKFPAPTTCLGVQCYLGMVNYYRRFVPRMAESFGPLYALIAGKNSKKSFLLAPDCKQAFTSSKALLSRAVLLHHPVPLAPTSITVDASEVAVRAELSQQDQLRWWWVPLAFLLFPLSDTPTEELLRQYKYGTINRVHLSSGDIMYSMHVALS